MNRRGFMQALFGGAVAMLLPKPKPPLQTKPLTSLSQKEQDKILSRMCNTTDNWPKNGQITIGYPDGNSFKYLTFVVNRNPSDSDILCYTYSTA